MIKKIGFLDDYFSRFKAFGIPNIKGKKSGKNGFGALRKNVEHGLASVEKKLSYPQKASAKEKIATGLTKKFTTAIERRFEGFSNVYYQRAGNISSFRQESQVKGHETIRTASESTGTVVKDNGKAGQHVQFNEQKESLTNIGSQLNRVVNAQTALNTYTDANKLVREWDTQSTVNQAQNKQTDSSSKTYLERTIATVDQKGNVIGEQFLHRQTQVNSVSDWQQQSETVEQKNVRQETSSEQKIVGDARIVATEVKTESSRQAETGITAEAHADTQVQMTDLNKDGSVRLDRTQYLFSDSTNTQNISAEEETESLRNILTIYQGQQSVTLDKSKGIQELVQTTLGRAEQVTGQLDADGNVIAQKTTVVDTQSTLERNIQTENNRIITRGPEGVAGTGLYTEKAVTTIETDRLTNGTIAAETGREIESKKTVAWEGSIQKDQTDAGATFTIQNVETAKIKVGDVTTTGQNKLAIETQQQTGKTVEGIVSYQAADEVSPVQAPAAQVGINFGTYTGLSSGFKMDNGEVSFRLSFSSAQMTKQETIRTAEGEVVSDFETKTGEINDAELVGTLRSFTTDDGRRVVELSASYVKSGEKFAVEKEDDAGAALAAAETKVEIKGNMVIAGTASDKSIESSFDVYKTEEAEAAGTSESAVRKALDISDPLRKSFTFDRGIFSFQLGFASLNLAVYA